LSYLSIFEMPLSGAPLVNIIDALVRKMATITVSVRRKSTSMDKSHNCRSRRIPAPVSSHVDIQDSDAAVTVVVRHYRLFAGRLRVQR
jgi:hypothetical protein